MKKILVVDDEEIMHLSIKRIFRGSEIEILGALNSDDALALISDEVGVVLTDISMPGMDGVTLTREIKESYPDLPIILMSGVDSNSPFAKDWRNSGAMKFIVKPFDPEELVRLILGLLR